jgi:anti-sigma factor RsiW
MDHRAVTHQLAAYVLGALSADERHEVEQHLAGCAACRRQADDLAASVNLLTLALAAASPMRPPTDLKDRVLHAVQASAAVPSPLAASARTVEGISQVPPSGALVNSHVARASDTSTPSARWRTVLAVAAVIALALALAWGVRLSEALDHERALRERVAAHFTQQQEIVLEVVDADDATRLILRSPDPDSRAYGKLFTRPDLPHVVAMAARLPIPPQGQTYHLWLTSQGRTFLAGVLPVNDQGFGLLTFDADHDGPVYEAARLTLQAPGAEAPGGETVLAWSE